MKVITLRLSDDEYKKIARSAEAEHRPISNFITASIIRDIEESFYVDDIEMAQIKSDEKLQRKIKAGHKDAAKGKGKMVG